MLVAAFVAGALSRRSVAQVEEEGERELASEAERLVSGTSQGRDRTGLS